MDKRLQQFLTRAMTVGAAVLTLTLTPATQAGKAPSTTGTPHTYAGRATVLGATVDTLLADLSLTVSDTGDLDPTGGMRDASALNVTSNPPLGLDLGVASAVTVGSGDRSDSTASVVALDLNVANLVTVTAGVLQSNAVAICSNGAASYSGSSVVTDLKIGSILGAAASVVVTGEPNQTITLLNLATIIINEQKKVGGRQVVNALHVIVGGALAGVVKADVVVSHADAGISCGTTTTPECPVTDFVTGGGYVISNGSKANFGFVGGKKPNGLQGHLQYNDKSSTAAKISGTSVSSYGGSGVERQVVYGCKVNGVASTCTMNVADNGEPGTSDSFGLSTGSGYSIGSQIISGGNIQLHKPSCPTTTSTKGGRPR